MQNNGGRTKCRAKTKAGKRCRALAGPEGLCSLHAKPGRAADIGRQGGKARKKVLYTDDADASIPALKTAEDVRTVLGQVISDVRAGKLDPKIASTMAYVANVQLRAFEVADLERRLKLLESGDLKPFLEQLKGRSEDDLEFFATNG